ncbi:MAG: cadmium-translocating P-type ATPase [Peptococcaceae bacterium]|nr:cadmium-translocating P-type ATPase [Peptococcaceae bacterium]
MDGRQVLQAANDTLSASGRPEAKNSRLLLKGLDCPDCAAKLEKRIAGLEGIEAVAVNFSTGRMNVRHTVTVEEILKAVNEAGYGAELWSPAARTEGVADRQKRIRLAGTALSGAFLAAGLLSPFLGAGRDVSTLLFLLSILSGGFPVFRGGFYAVRSLTLDMNFLMSIAVIGAAAIGQWSEGAAVVFLFALGNALQAYTVDKTRGSIRALMDLSPREAQVLRDGAEITLPVEEIKPGDTVIIKPGQSIPVDGVVTAGSSPVNQAPITGESVPVEKRAGDRVYAGTINEQGALEIKVTHHARESTLSRIIGLVEEAQAQKAPSQQLVDRFARYYTPAVVVGALAVAVLPALLFNQPFQPWFEKALILLVISCPCALVISTPVSIVSAIGSAARKGVLFKGGAYLEEAGALKIIAFDKTGTLTCGKPEVTDVVSAGDISPNELLGIAAAVEKFSEHHLARAILKKAEEQEVEVPPVSRFNSFAGKGAGATLNGKTFYVGNLKLFEDLGVPTGQWLELIKKMQGDGKTVVMVGSEERIAGLIAAADRVRPDTRSAIKGLIGVGIQKIVMLTGDNEGTAGAVAREVGCGDFRADLLPQDKLEAIRQLKAEGKVAMVGDGINDAPALAAADIGIAMGGAGTDTAVETADVALMADDLAKLPYAVRLSRKALRTIKHNISFSILIKAAFIAATFTGHATLWMAVFADTGASLLVTLNGMRLMLVKE